MKEKAVDAYIGKAAPFAQLILTHVRGLVHRACPDVIEEMKWSRPFFLHKGKILCNMSAFTAHCSVGFWGAEMGKVLRDEGVLEDGGMGSLGKIASVKDLPPDKEMVRYIRQAVKFIEAGLGDNRVTIARRAVKVAKPPVETPAEFAAALNRNRAAGKVFDGFSPSCKREYVEWISDAKHEATRLRRIEQAVEWIAEGKQRNWKYQACSS